MPPPSLAEEGTGRAAATPPVHAARAMRTSAATFLTLRGAVVFMVRMLWLSAANVFVFICCRRFCLVAERACESAGNAVVRVWRRERASVVFACLPCGEKVNGSWTSSRRCAQPHRTAPCLQLSPLPIFFLPTKRSFFAHRRSIYTSRHEGGCWQYFCISLNELSNFLVTEPALCLDTTERSRQ